MSPVSMTDTTDVLLFDYCVFGGLNKKYSVLNDRFEQFNGFIWNITWEGWAVILTGFWDTKTIFIELSCSENINKRLYFEP